MEDTTVSSFTIAVSDEILVDLRERLARTRWAEQIAGSGWDHGTDLGFLQELCRYWETTYDWRAAERRLNELAQFATVVDDQLVHGFHVRSSNPGVIPLVLLHGWPSTVAEFAKVVRPFAEPARHGTPEARPFHVICPELPGFGFSGPTSARGWNPERIATAFAEVLDRLGYDRFVAAGGDYGQTIALELAKSEPERVIGMYLTSPVASPPAAFDPQNPRADEVAYMARVGAFQQVGSGYLEIQRTRPQTVGYGLVDSPVALAAWIIDKLHAWTDCDGDLESVFTKDELITQVMMFWVTATGNSAARLYYETLGPGGMIDPENMGAALAPADVPTGFGVYPCEIARPPRDWVEASMRVDYWSELPAGGHFPAAEVPDLYVHDVREFVKPIV